jgi:hypothetical protein
VNAHKPKAALNLWAVLSPFDWWRGVPPADLPELLHLPSNRHYQLHGVVLREHDLEPCAVYRSPTTTEAAVVWCRPLREILEGENWEWHPRHNNGMSELASALEAHDRRNT